MRFKIKKTSRKYVLSNMIGYFKTRLAHAQVVNKVKQFFYFDNLIKTPILGQRFHNNDTQLIPIHGMFIIIVH